MSRVDRVVTAIRRAIEKALPWYDPELEARRHERTEDLRQHAIASRRVAEIVEPRVRKNRRAMDELHRLEQTGRGKQ